MSKRSEYRQAGYDAFKAGIGYQSNPFMSVKYGGSDGRGCKQYDAWRRGWIEARNAQED